MPLVQATVLYPNEDDATFDLDYYMKTHMPLVDSKWKELGLVGWSVTQYTSGHPIGSKAPYSIGAVLTWESQEHLEKALQHESSAAIFGDIANFSNKSPVLLAGGVVGSAGKTS